MIGSGEVPTRKLAEPEKKDDAQFRAVFDATPKLMAEADLKSSRIGSKT